MMYNRCGTGLFVRELVAVNFMLVVRRVDRDVVFGVDVLKVCNGVVVDVPEVGVVVVVV